VSNTIIQRFDNEWVDVTCERSVQCCDCGLVHVEEYRIVPTDGDGDHIIRKAVRDRRATANRRRLLKAKREGLFKELDMPCHKGRKKGRRKR